MALNTRQEASAHLLAGIRVHVVFLLVRLLE